jgi:exopolysaccharide biosynthesis protein
VLFTTEGTASTEDMKDNFSRNIASSRMGFAWIRISVLILCALCVLRGESLAQDFSQVHPGVEHAQVTHKIGDEPVKINLLRLDLTKVRLDVHHALDRAIGLETTSSIAKRKGAVAAINAGFFRLDKSEFAGDASELLMIDKKVLSDSVNNRIALYLMNTEGVTYVEMSHPGWNSYIWFGKKLITAEYIHRVRLNTERKADEIVLYTPEFGPTTRTGGDGVEVVVANDRVIRVIDGGNSAIPSNGFVISASGVRKGELIRRAKRKIQVTHVYTMDAPKGGLVEDVTNGVPQLIKNGKIEITWEEEKASKSFSETRHPRTAVAKLKDGKFLMVTVDGRQPGVSVGMSLQELAEYLLSLGAVDAMNLDGGGSTTMYLDGKVMNTPSDKDGERKIGDAIVVTLRK